MGNSDDDDEVAFNSSCDFNAFASFFAIECFATCPSRVLPYKQSSLTRNLSYFRAFLYRIECRSMEVNQGEAIHFVRTQLHKLHTSPLTIGTKPVQFAEGASQPVLRGVEYGARGAAILLEHDAGNDLCYDQRIDALKSQKENDGTSEPHRRPELFNLGYVSELLRICHQTFAGHICHSESCVICSVLFSMSLFWFVNEQIRINMH